MSLYVKTAAARTIRLSGIRHWKQPFFSTTACSYRESARTFIPPKVDYAEKYASRLQRRAEEQGLSVEELLEQIKEKEKKEKEVRKSKLERASPKTDRAYASVNTLPEDGKATPSSLSSAPRASTSSRKDSSPVKALSSILNLDRLLQTPHTPEQISVLWRAYHASRSGGTGRGFLCATIPVSTYEKMVEVAARYPAFVVPVPRPSAQVSDEEKGSTQPAEFFYLEWGFHGAPLELKTDDNPFTPPRPSSNPQTSTILFAPLQEYKHRSSFATPSLVLSHYTDLAQSHGLVLLRGEITPSTSGAPGLNGDSRYLLSQEDAQLLAMAVQRFYLWNDGESERGELLRRFYEKPDEFKWEDLLKYSEFST